MNFAHNSILSPLFVISRIEGTLRLLFMKLTLCYTIFEIPNICQCDWASHSQTLSSPCNTLVKYPMTTHGLFVCFIPLQLWRIVVFSFHDHNTHVFMILKQLICPHMLNWPMNLLSYNQNAYLNFCWFSKYSYSTTWMFILSSGDWPSFTKIKRDFKSLDLFNLCLQEPKYSNLSIV